MSKDPLDNPLVKAQSDRIAELVALLRELEWNGRNYEMGAIGLQSACPWCRETWTPCRKHDPDCRLKAAIGDE